MTQPDMDDDMIRCTKALTKTEPTVCNWSRALSWHFVMTTMAVPSLSLTPDYQQSHDQACFRAPRQLNEKCG
jgi:uncharacterized membrane protein YfbV (UPF0208 family)